ncbi:MAG: SRPBCC family protein [Chloroflexota bacterium]
MKTRTAVALSVGLSLAATGVAFCYDRRLRPLFRRWGATDAEIGAAMPGDEVVADPQWSVTYAVTVDAPRADVWPWLVQLGIGRAGFYSYDRLERRIGLDIHSVELIVPELQGLKVGDAVPFGAFEIPVAGLEPEKLLLLEAADDGSEASIGSGSFCFQLLEEPDGGTRLVVRGRARFRDWDLDSASRSAAGLRQLPMILGFEPGSFILFRRMLLGIRERAERTAREGRASVTAPEGWWAERLSAMEAAGRSRAEEVVEADSAAEAPAADPGWPHPSTVPVTSA